MIPARSSSDTTRKTPRSGAVLCRLPRHDEVAHHLAHRKWCVELLKVGAVRVHGIELHHVIGVGVGLVDDARPVDLMAKSERTAPPAMRG